MHIPTLRPAPVRVHSSTKPRLHVALVDEELPFPANSGKRIRTLNLIKRVARQHRVTYLCHRNTDAQEAELAREHFAQLGIDTIVVNRAIPRKSGLSFYARLGLNLLSSLPYSVASHDSQALRQAMRELAARESIDLWHCEWTPYAQPLGCLPGVRHIVMAHNVESLIWQRYFETESNPLKRWYIGRQWSKFERFERRVLSQASRAIAVSEQDAALLRDRFGVERTAVVDNGVDTVYFHPTGEPRLADRLLFLGSLEWRPNLDAVEQLLTHVLPALRGQRPTVTCDIVGRNPPLTLRKRIEDIPGVRLHADAADVRPFLHRCTLMVVPLRIGGGSRLKILEALATGTPVVSTRVGAEGLHLRDGEHLTICDTVGDLVGAVLDSLREPRAALARAEAGREVVCRRYDWETLADRLEEIWLDTCGHGVGGPR